MNKILPTITASIFLLIPSVTFAHHPLAGLPMETFTDGLLSGIGHPILGFDHLFFVVLAGVMALYTGYRYLSPAAYIAAMLIGCVMMSAGIELPAKEFVVGFSLLGLGTIVLSGKILGVIPTIIAFSFFGLFHGSAFGDAIAGQEAIIGNLLLIGYLLGLGVTQYAIAIAAGWTHLNVLQATEAKFTSTRLAGAVVAGAGLFLTMENLETSFFSFMGWS